MNLKEKLKEARENLAEVKVAVEAGEKTADELEAAIKSVEELQKQIEKADEAEKLLGTLKNPTDEPAEKEETKMEYKNIGEFVAAQVKEGNIDPKKKFSLTAPAFKAASAMLLPSSVSPTYTATVDTNLVLNYRRPLMVADLFAQEMISGNALTYFKESATIEGSPANATDYTAEGGAKRMMSFGDPTAVTVPLRKIASYMKESDELIDDTPWLATAINDRGMYQHMLEVENYLVATLSSTSGIGTGNKLTPEGIFAAMMTVQNTSGYAPDAIVINPTDYQHLRLRKDGNNQYYGGGFFYNQYSSDGIVEQPSLWGLRTVVTSAVATGTCLVGAFHAGASVVRKSSGVTVDITNTDQDDFVKNLITILIEERLALAVRYPSAFVKISGSSTSTEF